MAGNPFYQDVDPQFTPPNFTPSDTPSSPSNFAGVTPHGRGPAPYDIQAPGDQGAVDSAFGQSIAEGAAGALYPASPRFEEARTFLESPQGFGLAGFDIFGGFHGTQGGDEGWPADVEPVHDGP